MRKSLLGKVMGSRIKKSATTRQFIRHPTGMPIQFRLEGDIPPLREQLRNVSEGGLCFCAHVALEAGHLIHLSIPAADRVFEADGVVTWCQEAECGYEIGVRFSQANDLYGVRMVEQLCYIEEYRQEIERDEGRVLSSEEAASEWISRFAADFPRMS